MSPRPWSKMISAATRLSAQPNNTAVGFCACGEPCPVRDALAGMRGRARDEALVTLLECLPRGHGAGIGHGRHCAASLLDWYRAANSATCRGAGRGSPPWQILVSEFMLQQTPVARVEPIWLDWVARWPTPSATAAASAADVLRAWGKLGYPRRAKRLHECATVIAAEHGDVVPDDVDTLLTLPGVGAYTARAVACFAYRQAGARRRHQRAPGGRQGGARPRRRGRFVPSATSPTSKPCCPMRLMRRASRRH